MCSVCTLNRMCKKYNYLVPNGVVVGKNDVLRVVFGVTLIVTIIIWSILTIY